MELDKTSIERNSLPFRRQALQRVKDSITIILQERDKLQEEEISLLWEDDEITLLKAITDELRQVELFSEALGKVMQANFRRVEDQE